jgi:hypothetical protein
MLLDGDIFSAFGSHTRLAPERAPGGGYSLPPDEWL